MKSKSLPFIILVFILLAGSFVWNNFSKQISPSVSPPQVEGIQTAPTEVATASAIGPRTKISNCQLAGPIQDKACTPGAVISGVTREQICTPGYSKNVRNVPTSTKDEVYREYSISSHQPGEYEVDHLISLELGGSNDVANLWPESAEPRPGFHEKDIVENYLHQQVCNGSMTLEQSQDQIANNWLEVYSGIK